MWSGETVLHWSSKLMFVPGYFCGGNNISVFLLLLTNIFFWKYFLHDLKKQLNNYRFFTQVHTNVFLLKKWNCLWLIIKMKNFNNKLISRKLYLLFFVCLFLKGFCSTLLSIFLLTITLQFKLYELKLKYKEVVIAELSYVYLYGKL